MKPYCEECYWVCSLLFVVLWATCVNACVLDVTPDPYIPPPLMLRDAGSEDQ